MNSLMLLVADVFYKNRQYDFTVQKEFVELKFLA